MPLLHTESLQFEKFFDSKVPEYTILSHRWEEKEISFQDFEKGKEQGWPGFIKIDKLLCACEIQRLRLGLDRHLLHRQEEQRRAFRGNQFDVPLVR